LNIVFFKYQKYKKNEKKYLLFDGADYSGEFEKYVEDPIMNLFVWAILLNRIEIATIFWQIGHVKFIYSTNLK
jgi:hypothetical protein